MKIAFMNGNTVHWITPYKTLDDIPEHPPGDIYIEIPDHVKEGWRYDGSTEEFKEPSAIEAQKQQMQPATLEMIAQQLSNLEADLIIAGVI